MLTFPFLLCLMLLLVHSLAAQSSVNNDMNFIPRFNVSCHQGGGPTKISSASGSLMVTFMF